MLMCIPGLDRLRLILHNQLLENLRLSGGPVIYGVMADVVPAGSIGLELRFFP